MLFWFSVGLIVWAVAIIFILALMKGGNPGRKHGGEK